MERLEKKLQELGYEYSASVTFIASKITIKHYSKQVGENEFNKILITKEGIYQTIAVNEIEMQKDLEVLRNVESER